MVEVLVTAHGANGESVPGRALVDSGADRSMLPDGFAEDFELELNLMPTVPGTGASGDTKFRIWTLGASVELRGIGHTIDMDTVLFGPVRVPVLGRLEFFTSFRTTIDEQAEAFSLEPY